MKDPRNSYTSILRSSSIVGGAQGINLLIGIVRIKFVAVLIGPVGFGLIGTYQAMTGLAGTVTGLGIQSSAVRDVAIAVGKGDSQRIGETVLTLKRMALLTGLCGGVLLALLAKPLSQYTFGTADYAVDIALLGLTILLGHLAGGLTAMIQGMRRIGDLARLNVLGAVTGTLVALGFYSTLGLRGIVPALLSMAAVNLAWAWYFSRRVSVPAVQMSWADSIRAAGGMVRLGLALMWNGLLGATVAFVTRALINQEISLEAVGIFSAAFALSGMFVDFVLQAMSADYYPRLTAVAADHQQLNRLVNEQTEIGLLLAAPGLLLTLALAPWIIRVFYTAEFLPAAELLQWFALGCLGRVISWPLGFVMLAMGKGAWFALTETTAHVLHLSMIWVGIKLLGIEGVSVAFFVLYLAYPAIVYAVAARLSGFTWSRGVVKLSVVLLPVMTLTFLLDQYLSLWPATIIGLFLGAITSVFCVRAVVGRTGLDSEIGRRLLKLPGMRWVVVK